MIVVDGFAAQSLGCQGAVPGVRRKGRPQLLGGSFEMGLAALFFGQLELQSHDVFTFGEGYHPRVEPKAPGFAVSTKGR